MAAYDSKNSGAEPWWTISSMTMQTPDLPVMDYVVEMGPSGSFQSLCPGEPIADVFLTDNIAGFSSLNKKSIRHDIAIHPVPVEICYMSPPPDQINLEPTRFRKTYSYFRQRPRKF